MKNAEILERVINALKESNVSPEEIEKFVSDATCADSFNFLAACMKCLVSNGVTISFS